MLGLPPCLHGRTRLSLRDLDLEDLTAVKSTLMDLYATPAWAKAMFSVFVNYPLNNPSFKGETRKRGALEQFFDELLQGVQALEDQGNCMACGRRSTRKPKSRQHIPMTGSGGLRNFFSYASQGADYCDTCAFAIQCAPLTLYACGKLLLVHSNSYKVLRVWAKHAVTAIQRQIATGEYTGCFNEGYTNARNALFHIAQELTRRYEERWAEENATIRLYHFTNYIQGPELDIHDLPAPSSASWPRLASTMATPIGVGSCSVATVSPDVHAHRKALSRK
jgi:CRISPR-associated protein Cst1